MYSNTSGMQMAIGMLAAGSTVSGASQHFNVQKNTITHSNPFQSK